MSIVFVSTFNLLKNIKYSTKSLNKLSLFESFLTARDFNRKFYLKFYDWLGMTFKLSGEL
jgi:hypothetical protein